MNPVVEIYNLIFYQPLSKVLFFLYEYLNDFGLAIIFLTILIKLILYPLTSQSLKSQKKMLEIRPKIEEIEKKYKKDKERRLKELISLYRKERINPLGGFFLFLLQIPVLIALYQIFLKEIETVGEAKFLGIINLSQPSLVLAFLAGIFQFFQSKMMLPYLKLDAFDKVLEKFGGDKKGKEVIRFSKIFQKQMLYLFPALTFLILLKLPSALGLYWAVMVLFSIVQQYLVFKSHDYSK